MVIDQCAVTAVDAVDAECNAGRQRPMVRDQRATVDAVDAITLADNALWIEIDALSLMLTVYPISRKQHHESVMCHCSC